jgi:hypothetical protein
MDDVNRVLVDQAIFVAGPRKALSWSQGREEYIMCEFPEVFTDGSYEFGLTIVHYAATLQRLHSGPNLKGNPGPKRCPRLLNRPPISNGVSNVNMTVIRNRAYRCST